MQGHRERLLAAQHAESAEVLRRLEQRGVHLSPRVVEQALCSPADRPPEQALAGLPTPKGRQQAARADHRRQTGQLVEVLRDMQADARRLGATIERSPRRAGNLAPSYVVRSQGRGRRKGKG